MTVALLAAGLAATLRAPAAYLVNLDISYWKTNVFRNVRMELLQIKSQINVNTATLHAQPV